MKKTASKQQPKTTDLRTAALDHENEGRWLDAAKVWTQLSKTGSKKERADFAGRAAAAKVRAEAKPAVASEPEPQPEPDAPAEVAPVEPAPADATAAPETPTVAPKPARAPKEPPAPRERDPRLPPVGAVIQKLDRHGAIRCESTVEDGGVRYNGQLYKSLSGAAMAAAKDLGLSNKTQNGFAFWGITKPARPDKDVLKSLAFAWKRYHERADEALKGAKDDASGKVQEAINAHAKSLIELVGLVV
jgi:hypothetical protein